MSYSIINATLLDGTKEMQPQQNMTIVVEGERISRIEKDGALLEGSEVIDLKGAYIMPGLINMHVHLAAAGDPPKSAKPVNYKNLAAILLKFGFIRNIYKNKEKEYAKNELYSGVTTLRAVGGLKDFDGQIRDMINAGQIEGPRILSANTAISVPGGHFAGSLATESRTPEEAVKDLQAVIATKPDLIKIMVTGGVMDASEEGEPGALRMSPEIVKAVCDEAHKHGFKVAAHIESTEGVRVALENGVDTVEHGAVIDEHIIDLFKQRGAADVCTLSPTVPYANFELSESLTTDIGKKNGTIVMNGIISCAKTCLENDIPVGMGTDTGCPFITHYDMWRELYYFKKFLNVSGAFTLYSATLGNAAIAGIDKEVGSIEVGKIADMIVSKNDPFEDFTNLKNLEYVFARGKKIEKPQVKRNEVSEKLIDKYMYL